jgi:hypothetical protein
VREPGVRAIRDNDQVAFNFNDLTFENCPDTPDNPAPDHQVRSIRAAKTNSRRIRPLRTTIMGFDSIYSPYWALPNLSRPARLFLEGESGKQKTAA